MKILKTKLKHGDSEKLREILGFKNNQSISNLLAGRTALISEWRIQQIVLFLGCELDEIAVKVEANGKQKYYLKDV